MTHCVYTLWIPLIFFPTASTHSCWIPFTWDDKRIISLFVHYTILFISLSLIRSSIRQTVFWLTTHNSHAINDFCVCWLLCDCDYYYQWNHSFTFLLCTNARRLLSSWFRRFIRYESFQCKQNKKITEFLALVWGHGASSWGDVTNYFCLHCERIRCVFDLCFNNFGWISFSIQIKYNKKQQPPLLYSNMWIENLI